jgi:hypothetical protein
MKQPLETILLQHQEEQETIDLERTRLKTFLDRWTSRLRQRVASYQESIRQRRQEIASSPIVTGLSSDETLRGLMAYIARSNSIIDRLVVDFALNDGDLKIKSSILQRRLKYLSQMADLSKQKTRLSRGDYMAVEDREFHSLWIADSPVFRYENGDFKYLFETRKDRPLKLKTARERMVIDESDLDLAQKLIGLEEGDFCNYRGFCLIGDESERASAIFDHVMNGAEILPNPSEPSGYIIKGQRIRGAGNGESEKLRPWGQDYLASLKPTKVTQGELFASGGFYIAYSFGDRTVVEFSNENRATYCFDTLYFESLSGWNRATLLHNCPPGFNGRVIHKKDRGEWENAVNEYVFGAGNGSFCEDPGLGTRLDVFSLISQAGDLPKPQLGSIKDNLEVKV